MLEKVEGVVIRTRDYGESNKVVTLFTRERGKMAAMARGAKKPKSRLGAATQPFTLGQYLCFAGSGMATLSQADILASHYSIRSDLTLASYAAYLAELLDKLTGEKEPAPELYELLLTTFRMLEKGVDPEILSRIFELKVLEAAGYRPRLDGCIACGKADLPVRFSVRQGGFLCRKCQDRDPRALTLSPAAARILKTLQRITPDRLGDIQVKDETKAQLERAVRSFVDEYADLKLKSRDFLDRLKRDWT
ncbi:DNA replication and repair protein RecO [Melghirimyces profundicolus]|uniref:DNA repair protein RecO n=1 Tax=Melghirimyces profundicolus TaxID=1242148 RepID=A0A2T6C983_9BACL|nr:DNA repair protein RecO [Melghirimyces profundicolus]PTX64874.1 DNA replication and repair protein RecO [Melghirimyces profundicolus]